MSETSVFVRKFTTNLVHAKRGAAAMEFALCGSAFIALIFASLVTALTMFAQQNVQTVTDQMARSIMTGQAQLAGTTAAQFKQQTCARLPSFLSCNRIMIDMRRANDFDSVDVAAPVIAFDRAGNVSNTWNFDSVAPGDVVILRVMYLWPITNLTFGRSLSNTSSGNRLLVGVQVFKAEDYS